MECFRTYFTHVESVIMFLLEEWLNDFGWQLKKCHPAAIRCCFTAIGDSTHVFEKIHIFFIPRQSWMLSRIGFYNGLWRGRQCVGVVTRSGRAPTYTYFKHIQTISNLINGGHECSQFLGQRSGSSNRQDIFDGFHGSLENISDGIQSTGPEERCNTLKIGKKGRQQFVFGCKNIDFPPLCWVVKWWVVRIMCLCWLSPGYWDDGRCSQCPSHWYSCCWYCPVKRHICRHLVGINWDELGWSLPT